MPSPLISATFQSTCIAAASNVTAQVLDSWDKNEQFTFSLTNLFRFVLLNVIIAPPNFHWQAWLERTFPAREAGPSRKDIVQEDVEMGDPNRHGKREDTEVDGEEDQFSWTNTFKKWFLDCMTMGALLNTVAFLVLMGTMKRKSIREIGQAVQTETFPIIIAGYKIWPIASVVNFTFIPVEKRIVFLSFVGFLWGIYLSLVAARQ